MQAANEDLSRRLSEAAGQLKEVSEERVRLKQQLDAAAADVDSLKRRSARLEESLGHKDKELGLLGKEKDDLASELGVASQTLLKRGDDFSESLRLLQRRLESSDSEAKALHAKLRTMHEANVSLSSELEQAKGMVQQLKARQMHAGMPSEDSKQLAAMQDKLAAAEGELKRRDMQYAFELEQERAALRRGAAELQALQSQAMMRVVNVQAGNAQGIAPGTGQPGEVQALQERINELDQYVQEVQPQIERTQRENDTLTAEMDKILAENAMLRNELDEVQDRMEASQQQQTQAFKGHNMGHTGTPNMRATQALPASPFANRPPAYAAAEYPASNGGAQGIGMDRFSWDERPRRTSGVHGMRLTRDVMMAWANFTVDMRGAGNNTSFRCLNYFCDNEGHLAAWMPNGRLRRSELDVKNEKIGSGTFADVFRGDIRIPCAIKKIKGNIQQKEVIEFVREGEMMRKVNHPNIAKLLGVSTGLHPKP